MSKQQRLTEADWTALSNAVMEDVQRASKSIIAFGKAFAEAMRPTVEAMEAFAVEFDAKVQAAYRAAGEPRGPGAENAYLWFRTCAIGDLATPTPAEPSPPPRPAPPHQPAP